MIKDWDARRAAGAAAGGAQRSGGGGVTGFTTHPVLADELFSSLRARGNLFSGNEKGLGVYPLFTKANGAAAGES